VCPSGCIHLSNSLQFEIVISSEDCINCGLCVSACKYGALYLGESFVVINNDSKFLKTSNALDENVLLTQNKLTELPRQLSLSGITIEHLINVTEKIKAESRQSNGYENIVVRNMLLQCGLKAVLRAIGNNDIRFDLIAKLEDNYYMVGEIALRENDTLDRPRKILDDIAVLHNRYKIPIDKIIPVIFISSFPNKRSDYYEIIQDINCELGIRIRTVPLAILLLLVYSDKKISLNDLIHSFYISKSNYSILDTISDELKELIMSFTDGEISLFQAVK
ncbi:MAG: 4Fe-4S binding protein, partial [Sphingobacteriia bacterium]|nr:4Fe-4S binding protein [Sphingobacteriia bacterium]